jgi:hypothetical protein
MLNLIVIYWLHIFHPLYVCVTEINYNAKNREIEITCRIFDNDLEKAINAQYRTSENIAKPLNKSKIDMLINDYVKKHLQIRVDNEPLNLTYLGYDLRQDAAWCYFEIKNVNTIKKIAIRNDILYSEHAEQSNILYVTVNGQRKISKIDNPQTSTSFSF